MTSPPWMRQAACRGTPDPDVFFPAGRAPEEAADAKAVCGYCPVSRECLDYALSLYSRGSVAHGIWGATTEAERDGMLRAGAVA